MLGIFSDIKKADISVFLGQSFCRLIGREPVSVIAVLSPELKNHFRRCQNKDFCLISEPLSQKGDFVIQILAGDPFRDPVSRQIVNFGGIEIAIGIILAGIFKGFQFINEGYQKIIRFSGEQGIAPTDRFVG